MIISSDKWQEDGGGEGRSEPFPRLLHPPISTPTSQLALPIQYSIEISACSGIDPPH